MKEKTIYLKDLLRDVLKKWRVLPVFIVLLALLMNAYGWYRVRRAEASREPEKTAVSEVERTRAVLSPKEIADAEERAEAYRIYYEQYQETHEHMKRSVLFNMDPSAVPSYKAVLYCELTDVDADPEGTDTDTLADVMVGICSVIESRETQKMVSDIFGLPDDQGLVRELYKTSTENGSLILKVYGRTEEEAKKAGEAIIAEVLKKESALEEIYGPIRITLVGARLTTHQDTTVSDWQQKIISRRNTLESAMQTTGNNLSANAKKYYNALLNEDPEEPEENQEDSKPAQAKTKLIYPKYLLFGVALGVAAWFIFFALAYLMKDRVRTREEVEEYYGVRVLSDIRTKERKGVDGSIDRLFRKHAEVFDEADGLKASVDRILYGGKRPEGAVLISYDKGDEKAAEIGGKLADALREKGQTAESAEAVTASTASMETLKKTGGLVFVKTLSESSADIFSRELRTVSDAGTDVLGAVLLRK